MSNNNNAAADDDNDHGKNSLYVPMSSFKLYVTLLRNLVW